MTQFIKLEEELKKIIEENTKEFVLDLHPDYETEPRAPVVVIGNQSREILHGIIPCIIIKTPSGKNTLLEKLLTITVDTVIYDTNTSKAYKTLYEIMEKISTAIIEKGVILNKFEISPAYEWNISDEETYPYWAGSLNFHIVTRNNYRTDVDNFILEESDWRTNGK